MVGFYGNGIYQMKEKVVCYIIYGCYGLFLQSRILMIFFNQYCSNLLKNPTVRGLTKNILSRKVKKIVEDDSLRI